MLKMYREDEYKIIKGNGKELRPVYERMWEYACEGDEHFIPAIRPLFVDKQFINDEREYCILIDEDGFFQAVKAV